MYPITNAVKALFDANYQQVLRVTGTDRNGTPVTITDANVTLGGFRIDRFSCIGEKIEVGTAVNAELTLRLDNHTGAFNNIAFEGCELFVEVGIADWTQENPTVNWIPCGYFTPEEQPRKLNHINLVCLDRMTRFDVDVDASQITFPITVARLVRRICALCNVTLVDTIYNKPNSGTTIESLPTIAGDITYRNLIQWCAGMMGTNAWFDWDGKLRFSWYENQTGYTTTIANRYNSDFYENDLTITGMIYTNFSGVEIVSGTDDYAIDLTGNYLVEPIVASVLSSLHNYYSGFSYRPFTASVFNAPYLWPMDLVTFTDKAGNNYTSALTNVMFGLNGATALESKGMTYAINALKHPNGVTKQQAQLINEVAQSVEDLDDSLTQEEIFNRLTDNGTAQGIFLSGGQVYINASYLTAGELNAAVVRIKNLSASDISSGLIHSADYQTIQVPKIYPATTLYPSLDLYPSNGEYVTRGFAIDFETGQIYGGFYSEQIATLSNTVSSLQSAVTALQNALVYPKAVPVTLLGMMRQTEQEADE